MLASPYKFGRGVLSALKGEAFADALDKFFCADELERVTGLEMPPSLRELRTKPQLHSDVVAPLDMIEEVRLWTQNK